MQVNQSINQSMNQSVSQSINQTIKRSINESNKEHKLPGINVIRHLAEEPGTHVCTNALGSPMVPGTFVQTVITGAFMKGVLGLSKPFARLV